MSNDKNKYGRASRRSFLKQESVFLGFNDYKNGVWGEDYETKGSYWQVSYEWGRQISQWCESKEIKINWKTFDVVPRDLTNSVWNAVRSGYILLN